MPIRRAKSELEDLRRQRKREFEQLQEEESVIPKTPDPINATVIVPKEWGQKLATDGIDNYDGADGVEFVGRSSTLPVETLMFAVLALSQVGQLFRVTLYTSRIS